MNVQYKDNPFQDFENDQINQLNLDQINQLHHLNQLTQFQNQNSNQTTHNNQSQLLLQNQNINRINQPQLVNQLSGTQVNLNKQSNQLHINHLNQINQNLQFQNYQNNYQFANQNRNLNLLNMLPSNSNNNQNMQNSLQNQMHVQLQNQNRSHPNINSINNRSNQMNPLSQNQQLNIHNLNQINNININNQSYLNHLPSSPFQSRQSPDFNLGLTESPELLQSNQFNGLGLQSEELSIDELLRQDPFSDVNANDYNGDNLDFEKPKLEESSLNHNLSKRDSHQQHQIDIARQIQNQIVRQDRGQIQQFSKLQLNESNIDFPSDDLVNDIFSEYIDIDELPPSPKLERPYITPEDNNSSILSDIPSTPVQFEESSLSPKTPIIQQLKSSASKRKLNSPNKQSTKGIRKTKSFANSKTLNSKSSTHNFNISELPQAPQISKKKLSFSECSSTLNFSNYLNVLSTNKSFSFIMEPTEKIMSGSYSKNYKSKKNSNSSQSSSHTDNLLKSPKKPSLKSTTSELTLSTSPSFATFSKNPTSASTTLNYRDDQRPLLRHSQSTITSTPANLLRDMKSGMVEFQLNLGKK